MQNFPALPAIIIIIVVLAVFASVCGFDERAETDEYVSQTSSLRIQRELRCEEDEDIVVTLGSNGLPFAYCKQVIER